MRIVHEIIFPDESRGLCILEDHRVVFWSEGTSDLEVHHPSGDVAIIPVAYNDEDTFVKEFIKAQEEQEYSQSYTYFE